MKYSLKNEYRNLIKEDSEVLSVDDITPDVGIAQVRLPDDVNTVRFYRVTSSDNNQNISGTLEKEFDVTGISGIKNKLSNKLKINSIDKNNKDDIKIKKLFENKIISDVESLFINSYVNRNNIVFNIMSLDANQIDSVEEEDINSVLEVLDSLSKNFRIDLKSQVSEKVKNANKSVIDISLSDRSSSKFDVLDSYMTVQGKSKKGGFKSVIKDKIYDSYKDTNSLVYKIFNKFNQSELMKRYLDQILDVNRNIDNLSLMYDFELGTVYFKNKNNNIEPDNTRKIFDSRFIYLITMLYVMQGLGTLDDYNSVKNAYDQEEEEVNPLVLSTNIMREYSNEFNDAKLYRDLEGIEIREKYENLDEVITVLNDNKTFFENYSPANRIGRGEFACHLLFQTTNCFLPLEPDAIIRTERGDHKCSVKSFIPKSGNTLDNARTGENMSTSIANAYDSFLKSLQVREPRKFYKQLNKQFLLLISVLLSNDKVLNKDLVKALKTKEQGKQFDVKKIIGASNNIDNLCDNNKEAYESTKLEYLKGIFICDSSANDLIKLQNEIRNKISISDVKRKLNMVKKSVISEHDAEYVICFNKLDGAYLYDCKSQDYDRIALKYVSESRTSFNIDKTSQQNKCNFYLGITEIENVLNDRLADVSESFIKRNRSLKLLYSNLYRQKAIVEGGKAGHMMHPYENLHMKISDMKRLIEDFQNDFEISEKVDGANLFFSVDSKTGKVLFSRNKSDMSYEETLEKFGPSHPAHVLFDEGTRSIFNAVQRALKMSEIKEIFGQHPEGGKTYINFEIMHPKKPNQIKYDMKYIVFHAIVDFDMNGNKVASSPDDSRLIMLLDKLQPYFRVYDNDFNLGSNLKIKLNNLSESDIHELLSELNKITDKLGISDNMTIADAVKKEVTRLLDQNNLLSLLSDEKIDMIYDFITNESSNIKGVQIKKGLDKEISKALTSLGLTSKTKAYKIIKKVNEDFKALFVLLGIKLLHNIPSRYMSSDASSKNVRELKDLLVAAISDYDNILNKPDMSDVESKILKSLAPHISNVRKYGIDRIVSSPVEGGVFTGKDQNTYKVTGGFAPLNQILGTSMRNLDLMPLFKAEFIKQKRGS